MIEQKLFLKMDFYLQMGLKEQFTEKEETTLN